MQLAPATKNKKPKKEEKKQATCDMSPQFNYHEWPQIKFYTVQIGISSRIFFLSDDDEWANKSKSVADKLMTDHQMKLQGFCVIDGQRTGYWPTNVNYLLST